MAATTFSATNVERSPVRQLSEGLFAQTFRYDYNGTSTISASDVIVLGYINQGVRVVDGYAWGGDGATGTTFKFGIGATDNNLSTAVTLSAGINRFIGFAPASFSLSADAEGNLKLQIIATKAAGTSTVSGSVNLTLIMMSLPA
jgi:hypothetical protein